MNFQLNKYLKKNTEAAPLAVFRIFFGLMMFISIIRFWSYGWIDKLYVQPTFFFSYYGFDFIKPIGSYTYLIFILCAVSALLVMIGYKYRIAIIVFFLSFTYIELMDKTTYLNHYYFISILSFLLIFLPANAYYSLDAKIRGISFQKIPVWTIDTPKLLIGIVYFYAGLAKLNSDWLLSAMPLKIWLPSKYDIPLIGDLMQQEWVHYAFSYTGAIYDLTIPFLLLSRKTRVFAFMVLVVFHILTRVLFPIGMFPYVMIVSALIFFDGNIHHKILQFISRICNIKKIGFDTNRALIIRSVRTKIIVSIVGVFFVIQLLLPFRYMLYPGELFWTEEGYRFSWRVMLMEKAGYANFKIVDQKTGKRFYVDNDDFLTPFQQKQMATQPDFILEYANYLKKHFEKQGHQNVQVFVESYVALNGRLSSQYIDPTVDLGKQEESFKHKTWIIPFKDEIKGL
ncbi:HTTM domain-containing protein [Aquimarina sp. LLG6339-5]|uniref:HTTM domain-containing protein n=1 Tax=Aquimarina sp. LLG6339-5 TaxID=3160830 RepID=UPI003869E055